MPEENCRQRRKDVPQLGVGDDRDAVGGDKATMVADGLMGVGAAAVFLSLARSTIYLLMESGHLPFVKIGRSRRIPKRAVIELAARNLRGGWRGTGA